RPAFTAATGSFAVSGKSAGMLYQQPTTHSVFGAVGVFAISGKAMAFTFARKLPATVGAFNVTGRAANTVHGRPLSANVGTFILNAHPANIVATLRRINATPGAFFIQNQGQGPAGAAGLIYGHDLIPAAGSFSLFGASAGLLYQQTPGTHS